MNIKLIKHSLALFFLFLFAQGYAYDKKIHIYTTPAQTANYFWRPMITLGGEIILFERLGFCAEYGYKYYDIHKYETSVTESKGYSYRFELKIYDLHFLDIKNVNNYFSLEYRYIHDNHDGNFRYIEGASGKEINDIMGVHSTVDIVNVKYGVLIGLGSTLYMDIYCGLGVRYRDIKNSHREYDPDKGDEFANIEPVTNSLYLRESTGFYLNPTVGFKFGMRF